MNEIAINALSIGYRHRVVARGLTARIVGGQLTCLIGRNGLGKSTLLRTLAGLQPCMAGRVTLHVDGKDNDVAKVSRKAMARLVSVVLTERVDIRRMTVEQVAAMGRMPYTGFFGTLHAEDRRIVADALRLVGMETMAGRDIASLSDGERQKVMIAKALAQQTPAILLDEPTAFLDYPSKVGVMRLLGRLAHEMGKIVMVSTHDLDIALRTADRLLTIGDDGIAEVDKAGLSARLATM